MTAYAGSVKVRKDDRCPHGMPRGECDACRLAWIRRELAWSDRQIERLDRGEDMEPIIPEEKPPVRASDDPGTRKKVNQPCLLCEKEAISRGYCGRHYKQMFRKDRVRRRGRLIP
jgi:hypothetical protein